MFVQSGDYPICWFLILPLVNQKFQKTKDKFQIKLNVKGSKIQTLKAGRNDGGPV
jgi:hypothetical protein